MRRNLFFSLFLILGLGLAMSSCAPGVYAGASIGAPYPAYGPSYYGGYGYGPRYYAPRRVIVAPARRPYYHGGGGYHGDGGYHGGSGYRGGGGFHGGSRRGR